MLEGVAEAGVADRGGAFVALGGTNVEADSSDGAALEAPALDEGVAVSPAVQPAGGSTMTMLPHLGQARI
jgi:hypothetical protein